MSGHDEENWDDPFFVNKVLFRPDITEEEVQDIYKKWITANTYESMLSKPDVYTSLRVLGKTIKELFDSPESLLVLDVGAGTGLTGEVLRSIGITKVDAIEPQQESAEISESKGIYQKVFKEFVTKDKTPGIDDDTYDLVVSTGTFAPGHIPHDALIELARLAKPGGYVIMCIREEFLWIVPEYKDKLEPLMEQMVSQGKWIMVKKQRYPNHFIDKDGIMYTFRVC